MEWSVEQYLAGALATMDSRRGHPELWHGLGDLVMAVAVDPLDVDRRDQVVLEERDQVVCAGRCGANDSSQLSGLAPLA
jgi:hypothetical protein